MRKTRKIETTEWRRLDGLIFIPGLFHVKMAAANAYWRIHVQPAGDRNESLGAFEYISKLRPKSTGEFTSKNGPSFRPMHDSIHHIMWTDFLDIWCVEVKAKYGFDSLDAWADSAPTWKHIVKLSQDILKKHLPGDDFSDKQEEAASKRDQVFENLCLRNHHGLLYLELCRAMNYGDVGRILQLFPYFIAIFAATGKHKYAAHMTKFMKDLQCYPPYLREAVLRNWLYNPNAMRDGFRAFNWLQELNNLYTKVVVR